MTQLCALTDIPDRQAIEVKVGQRSIIVWRQGAQAYAYENHCPHARMPLQWQDNQFMSLDGRHLQCSVHGALFEPRTGYCLYGPCQGQALSSVAISQENGQIFLE